MSFAMIVLMKNFFTNFLTMNNNQSPFNWKFQPSKVAQELERKAAVSRKQTEYINKTGSQFTTYSKAKPANWKA